MTSSDGSSGNRMTSSDGGSGSKEDGDWLLSSMGPQGHFEQLEEDPEEEEMLPVFSLSSVGFTSFCVALGRHGPLLQVRLSLLIYTLGILKIMVTIHHQLQRVNNT